TQVLLENFYNFNGSPIAEAFAYRQSSGLYFTEGTYPPYPGTLDTIESMATNLGSIPTYITYDTGDPLPEIAGTNEAFENVLFGLGSFPTKVLQSGTVDGDGLPAEHSWSVLDETELFDFWDGLSVDRYPEQVEAQQDLGGEVSWLSTTQNAADAFSYVNGVADRPSSTITIDNVTNAAEVEVHIGATSITSAPRIIASAAVGQPFSLRLSDSGNPPSYLLDHATAALIPLVDSDPSMDSLIVEIAGGSSLDVDVIYDPQWTSTLASAPNPVTIGNSSTVVVNCPSTADNAWMVIALEELLLPIQGVTLTASPIPPAFLILLPLDASGGTSFLASIPNDPLFSGIRIPIQVMALDSLNTPFSVSNLWGFRID
ncbi:MAG: hypothetical protein ACI9EF_003383, partial [Pseudohongiellaceae bacterium]